MDIQAQFNFIIMAQIKSFSYQHIYLNLLQDIQNNVLFSSCAQVAYVRFSHTEIEKERQRERV